jgi:hypothetical protein
MDIGTEHDKEIFITAPERTPVELPIEAPALPEPVAPTIAPEKVPA